MIQRIQTVYLVIVALLLITTVVFPGGIVLASLEAGEDSYMLFTEKLMNGETEVSIPYGLIGALLLGLLLSVYSIMQYKNRKFQMKLVQAAMFVQLVFGALVFFYADQMSGMATDGVVSYKPVLGVLILNLVLYFLALRGIKKDDALVRSADRLR